jgi:voltage-gated potassium channel
LRRISAFLNRRMLLEKWFPHVPLFIIVAAEGVAGLLPTIQHAIGNVRSAAPAARFGMEFATLAIRGLPQGVVGVLLIVMAFGLLFRSRLSWLLVLFTNIASVAFVLIPRSGTPVSTAIKIVILFLLLVSGRRFNRSSLAAGTLYALTSTILLLAYAVLVSYALGDQFAPPITDFGTALYYVIVTMATVGYGDIIPKTPEARYFVMSVIVLGITIFATSISAILVPMIGRRMERLVLSKEGKMKRAGHYIIVGDTTLARNSYLELRARGEDVTFVLPETPPEGIFTEADVVVGDGSDLDVLKKAGAEKAKGILALTDDDSENAFVVLAAKELSGTAKTVAAVSNAKNLARVRMVQPDMMVAPEVLGGEVLAMALSGESITELDLLGRFLHRRTPPE